MKLLSKIGQQHFFGAIALFMLAGATAYADTSGSEYVLGPADIIHITVFMNPDLTVDTRVSESGTITFPLVGSVPVVGLTISQAEAALAAKLTAGHYVADPQVNILPTLIRGSQVTVVGYVNHPGRYPLDTVNTHVSDAIAAAGGIDPLGADTIYLIQKQDGKTLRKPLDVTDLFVKGSQQDELVKAGDTLYLPREPVFYVYGEVHSPGAFRLQRHMTVMQGLAVGGLVNEKTSERRIDIYRQDDDGTVHQIQLGLTDMLQANDVIFVKLSIF